MLLRSHQSDTISQIWICSPFIKRENAITAYYMSHPFTINDLTEGVVLYPNMEALCPWSMIRSYSGIFLEKMALATTSWFPSYLNCGTIRHPFLQFFKILEHAALGLPVIVSSGFPILNPILLKIGAYLHNNSTR